MDTRGFSGPSRCICILTSIFCLLLGHPVLCQQKVDITALNDRAIELSKNGMLGKAIEIWVELLEITEAEYAYRWVFHKNIGQNFQKLTKLPRAWWHLTQARKLAPEDGAKKLAKRIARLEDSLTSEGFLRVEVKAARLGEFQPVEDELANWYPLPATWWFKPGEVHLKVRSTGGQEVGQDAVVTPQTKQLTASVPVPLAEGELVVVASPPDAEIRVDDELLGIGRIDVTVAEGDHVLTVSHSGYVTYRGSFGIIGNGTEERSVVLLREADASTTRSSLHKWHWVALGSSLAVIGAGCGTYWGWAGSATADQRTAHLDWIAAQVNSGQPPTEADKDTDWENRLHNNVLPAEITSYILWGDGGAGLIASTVWMAVSATGTGEAQAARHLPTLAPMSVSGGSGLMLQLQF